MDYFSKKMSKSKLASNFKNFEILNAFEPVNYNKRSIMCYCRDCFHVTSYKLCIVEQFCHKYWSHFYYSTEFINNFIARSIVVFCHLAVTKIVFEYQ